jgi:hypothetical protein
MNKRFLFVLCSCLVFALSTAIALASCSNAPQDEQLRHNTTTSSWYVDLPEETPSKGDLLTVIAVKGDTIYLGYQH